MGLNGIVAALSMGYRDPGEEPAPKRQRTSTAETSPHCARSEELRQRLVDLEARVVQVNKDADTAASATAMVTVFHVRQAIRQEMEPVILELLQIKCAAIQRELELEFYGGNPLPFSSPQLVYPE